MLFRSENKKRERLNAGKSEEELLQLKSESELQGFEDYTDKANVGKTMSPLRSPSANNVHRPCSVTYSEAKKHIYLKCLVGLRCRITFFAQILMK